MHNQYWNCVPLLCKEGCPPESCITVVSPFPLLYIDDTIIIPESAMDFSQTTISLLAQLEILARQKLVHKNEVGVLIELAHTHGKLGVLDDLSFFAKFAHKTFGIMKRIGNDADGYDKLSKEFGESIENSKKLLNELLALASEEERKKFNSQFLALSPDAFEHLLVFLHDVSWYKNYLIDSRTH